jgi:hypothetical protein
MQVNPHPDFFVPLELKLPHSTKTFLAEFFVDDLKETQSKKKQLGLYPLPDSAGMIELKNLVDNFLAPLELSAGAYGAFALNSSTNDVNVHVDAMKLNTRLSFYELAETPGNINWWADDGTGYEDWRPSYLGDKLILDYRFPWVDELQAGKRTWDKCPSPVFSTSTAVPSAFVMTALPHNVVQGPGFRITVSCQVVDRKTKSVEDTWQHIRKYFNSTALLASAS